MVLPNIVVWCLQFQVIATVATTHGEDVNHNTIDSVMEFYMVSFPYNTHKSHPISSLPVQAMGYLLWVWSMIYQQTSNISVP